MKWNSADRAVQQRRLPDFRPRHRQDVADQHVLQMLALGRRLAHRQDRRGRRDRVADADDRLLRDARVPAADRREHDRADEGERQADPVDDGRVRVAARHRQQQRDRRAERGDLRQRQIHEDHPALDDVHAEVGVDAGQDQAGRRTAPPGTRGCAGVHASYFVPVCLIGVDQQVDVVVEQREVVGDLLRAADRRRQHEHLAAGLARRWRSASSGRSTARRGPASRSAASSR